MPHDEKAFLQSVRDTYQRGSAQDRTIRELAVRTFAPFLEPGFRALQLGYSEGIDSALLSRLVSVFDVVEGEPSFAEMARLAAREGSLVHECLFEDFALPEDAPRYDAVFALYVLEHVVNPSDVLRLARAVLKPSGRLFVAVPNARALSRQLALHMGLIDNLYALTRNDHNHGHRRVYDRAALNRDFDAGGFRIMAQGGLMLKLLADFQMDQLFAHGILGDAQVEGLYRMGLEYPDLCGSLFAVCVPEEIA
ncbi:MAG: hypothetical protein RLZZ303_1943 [Candidatus Hydrogenedentota bacterium]|jgi:2-polyprenyl-3-methyl-5-hydroxy-6-metoxy-1,4-benzoquinol methylase